MAKSYSDMTPAERTLDRIAKNRRIEESVFSGSAGLSLDGIVHQLDAHKQRATYGAVAELVGVLPRGLMSGRPKTPRYSWVVAATNGSESRRGFPTGYFVNQIHPDCYRQVCEGEDKVIDSADVLREWLSRSK
ncbi:MAG: hypothetical protein ABI759_07040 [Candidatus Solibacter sp.]